jgi:hypothetical protein
MKVPKLKTNFHALAALLCFAVVGVSSWVGEAFYPATAEYVVANVASSTPPKPKLNILAYNKKMIELANFGTTTSETGVSATSTAWIATSTSISSRNLWPASTVYPEARALLPFNRIFAYYGNFYSKGMGILGEYPADVMLAKLKEETARFQAADTSTPVIPAIDYIAVVAQGSPGADGKYRLRMPDTEIEHAISLAAEVHGLVFLDVQPGLSDFQTEIPMLEKYLQLPEVHLAMDPEFSMKTGAAPGTKIGTVDAGDINFAAEYLATLVKQYDLPPKILLIHRFTRNMVTGYQNIKPLPQVQIVLSMDGWGSPEKKKGTYSQVVTAEPVQFGGIKLFYKNDMRAPSSGLLTPDEVYKLKPAPIFVEYQ